MGSRKPHYPNRHHQSSETLASDAQHPRFREYPIDSPQAAARILMGLHPGAAQISQLPSGRIAVTTRVGATFLYKKPVCEFGYVTIEPVWPDAVHSS